MSWSSVIGQERVKRLLKGALLSGRIPNAWLFTGPEGVGKDAVAIEIAKFLRCENRGEEAEACGECHGCRTASELQNSNVQFVFALPSAKGEDRRTDSPMLKLSDNEIALIREEVEKKGNDPYYNISIPRAQQIKISSVRQIKRDAALSSTEPGMRIIIISEAHQMRAEAANAFLKTLEEPSPKTLLILTTSQREGLLPTIISRCQEVRFDQLSEIEIAEALQVRNNVDRTTAQLTAKLANGSYSRAVELIDGALHQLRFDIVAFLRGALKRSPVAAHKEIEQLTAKADRIHLERLLGLLALWLRDAYVLRLTNNESLVVNQDQLDDIRSFNGKFADAPIESMIHSVERSINAINRNVQPPLVLTVLTMQLADACYLQEKRGASSLVVP
ncbi:MAG: DNA polymerase III subunit [Ignavibacteriae bacterium]|nr:DNA polymerase III subunit [Ignavibacteriota bacterium]MCB9217109.1 DNA polymerase III subunit [Ignavibacteria bacterium]